MCWCCWLLVYFCTSLRSRRSGMMCVSSCGATCWTGCLPAAQSILVQHLFPLCPSLIGSTVCSSCSFFILSLRCSHITRCVQTVVFFKVHIHIVNLLYQFDAVVYQWFSSNIFYFDFNSPASERSVCAGSSSFCPELKPRWRDWFWQTGHRLPFRGPGSDPSPHGWAPCPFKTSGTAHHPGFP